MEAPGPGNDRLVSAETLDGLEGVVEGDTTFAAADPTDRVRAGLEGEAALWYRWTAPEDAWMQFIADGDDMVMRIAVGEGGPASPFTLLGVSGADESKACRFQFHAIEGVQYHIAVETVDGDRGRFVLAWAVAPAPPPNDDFAAAIDIGDADGSIEGSTAHATRELLEPLHADRTGCKSIWYRWTAPADGWMEFSTRGSGFDTLLAVYAGSALDRLSTVAANDDAPGGGLQSLVRFEAQKDERYYIAVDGYAGAAGDVVLSWSMAPPPPLNAAFEHAQEITGRAGEETADTTFANHEPGEPRHAGRQGGKSLWYRWTAPKEGWIHFSTEGSEFDTLLAVYIGDELAELQVVAENDDALGSRTSFVRFYASEGQEYRIAVDGHAGDAGKMRLTWQPGPTPPLNDDFDDAKDLAGVVSPCMVSSLHASTEPGEPRHADRTGGASIWFRWSTDRTGWVRFSTEGTAFDTLLAAYTGESLYLLRPLAANDDVSARDTTSRIAFRAKAGVANRIAVDGYYGAAGDVILSWQPLPRRQVLAYWWANRKYR